MCKSGFKESEETGNCETCYYYLGKCMIQCPSNTVKNKEFSICEDVSYKS